MVIEPIEDGGWTTLHLAATNGSANCLKILLRHGAEVRIMFEFEVLGKFHAYCQWDREEANICTPPAALLDLPVPSGHYLAIT